MRVDTEAIRNARILIVDDEQSNVDLLEACLADHGYEALWSTTDSRRVADLVEGVGPDLILLDLHMPHLDGYAVMARLAERRALEPFLPVLVLTADITADARQRALTEGATDFLSKPLDISEVLLRMRNLLETRFLHLAERRAREAAERAALRAQLLAETSRVMGVSLDYETALAALARLAVPVIAECCTIDLENADGTVVQLCAVHADPGEEARLRVWDGRPIAERDPVPLPSEEAHGTTAETARWGSVLAVPLRWSGRDFGVLTLIAGEAGRRYGPEDALLAEEVAARAAMGVENGRLFRAAQEATRARDDVLRFVAHDLRNPLSSIMLASGLIREATAPDAIDRSAAVIERAATQMNRLIEDLLEATRLETGGLSIQPRPTRVDGLIEEVAAVLAPLATAGSVEFAIDPGEEIPPVALDETRILQVISNLVGNALKFTPPGGRIRLECREMAGEIRFAVVDTGSGIPPEHLPNIFRPFWQANGQDRRGVGLGLPLARSIVEAHGGRMWVESVEGEGSTFIFTLPMTDAAGAPPMSGSQAADTPPRTAPAGAHGRGPQTVEA